MESSDGRARRTLIKGSATTVSSTSFMISVRVGGGGGGGCACNGVAGKRKLAMQHEMMGVGGGHCKMKPPNARGMYNNGCVCICWGVLL